MPNENLDKELEKEDLKYIGFLEKGDSFGKNCKMLEGYYHLYRDYVKGELECIRCGEIINKI